MGTVQTAIALGSNLGESYTILEKALVSLGEVEGINLISRSRWYKTVAIGPPQPDYLNGCAILAITLTPEELLKTVLGIEQDFGRVRRERWGPRTLDLDILFYGDSIVKTPTLEIPHPRLRERAFVLVPLAEIAADWVDPITHKTVRALLEKTVDNIDIHPYHQVLKHITEDFL
jgi:2-amino-4-hydroxy-6-hydroxymethyldihydropteridine diphosphokinase